MHACVCEFGFGEISPLRAGFESHPRTEREPHVKMRRASKPAKSLSELSDKRLTIKMVKARFQLYKDVAGKFRFRLRAPNNKIVAVGEAYETKDGCINGVHAIKKYCDADIEDLTTDKIREEEPASKASEEMAIGKITDETTLILEKPSSKVQEGSAVSFTGKLISRNKGIAGATIVIYESDRSFMKDDYLAIGETLEDGTFSINWKAKEMDWWDDTVEVYAAFRGAGIFKPSRSEKHVIKVS